MYSFTLVEVVIAIAVTSFVLVSILGMMAYAGQEIQQSDKYSRLSIVAGQVLAKLNSENFASSPMVVYLLANAGTGAPFTSTLTNYYTFEGLPTNSVNGTNIYFQVIIADASPTTGPIAAGVGGVQVIEPVQISILWPKVGSNPFANTNIIVSSVLNYNSL